MNILKEKLRDSGIPLLENAEVTVGLKVRPSKVGVLISPQTREDMVQALQIYRTAAPYVPLVVIAEKNSVIFACDEFNGVVLDTSGLRGVCKNGESIIAEAGVSLRQLVSENSVSLSGLQPCADIPGSVGGAMVASSELFESWDYTLEVFDLAIGKVKEVTHKSGEQDFGYSICRGYPNFIILRVFFHLKDVVDNNTVIPTSDLQKRSKTTLDITSKAFVFKANRYRLKDLDLLGMKSAGVEFSSESVGFLTNRRSDSSWKDVLFLLEEAHRRGLPITTSRLSIITEAQAWRKNSQ